MLEPGGWGGISQSSQYLAAALRDTGCEILFITATDAERTASYDEHITWPLIRWSRAGGVLRLTRLHRVVTLVNYLGALRAMYRRARREPPDIVHLQGFYIPMLFLLTARVLRSRTTRIVMTCHNAFLRSSTTRGGRLARWGVKGLLRVADVTVLHASDDLVRLRSGGLGEPRRAAFIALGWHPVIDVPRELARSRLGVGSDRFVIAVVGYIRADKGLDLLADAIAGLAPGARSQIRVVVAGEDRGGLAAFATVIARLGLGGTVDIRPGYMTLDVMSELIAAADVVLLAHREASDSGVIRMAMAAGVPVVAARVGALADVVNAAGNGWLFRAGDGDDLRRGLEAALNTEVETRRQMGRAGNAYAETHFSWARIASEYVRVYEAALTGR